MYLITMFKIYKYCKLRGYMAITHITRELSEIFLLNYKGYNIFTKKYINNKTELYISKLAKTVLKRY